MDESTIASDAAWISEGGGSTGGRLRRVLTLQVILYFVMQCIALDRQKKQKSPIIITMILAEFHDSD